MFQLVQHEVAGLLSISWRCSSEATAAQEEKDHGLQQKRHLIDDVPAIGLPRRHKATGCVHSQ